MRVNDFSLGKGGIKGAAYPINMPAIARNESIAAITADSRRDSSVEWSLLIVPILLCGTAGSPLPVVSSTRGGR
jgi:hypothetical protein